MPKLLTSANNPRIKEIKDLREADYRKKQKLFIIEGCRELQLALRSNIEITELYLCPEFFKKGIENKIIQYAQGKGIKLLELNAPVYRKIAFGNRQEGLLAIARQPQRSLADLKLCALASLVVVDKIEKPGNLGAIIRTADAAGIDAVIVSDITTDMYNPNVVRSSLGALFTTAVVRAQPQEAVLWLKKNNICILASCVEAKTLYTSVDFKKPFALVLGSEEKGLSSFWRENADAEVSIPMKGEADSLNVSAAAAILFYEALRQRSQ